MNTRSFLLALTMACSLQSMGQSVPKHEMYVDFGYVGLQKMMEVLPTWDSSKAASQASAQGSSYYDDNFFISRVPLKERFSRSVQQANTSLNADGDNRNAKNLCWWTPIGEMTKKWGPLPRWNFDGDNFNMWQYINVHGNWSNSWWRVPGSFNDVAHKNGVKTGCLLFIDWGSSITNTEGNIGKYLYQLSSMSNNKYTYAEKLVDYLRYYGIDGIGFNPEGSWQPNLAKIVKPFLAECHRIAEEKGWPFHVDWYAYVSNTGALNDNGCKLTDGGNDTWFQEKSTNTPVTDVFFLNYNWTEDGLSKSASAAKTLGRSPFDVYAGFDQQGRGYGKNGNAGWEALMKYPISVVVWGAHDRSQLYTDCTEGGTSDKAIQSEYQTKQEMLFSGGNRNVLKRPAINTGNTTTSYSSLQDWHGYASAVVEQSTLSEVPFVTRFNLGNGAFFNNEGVTTNAHKWYNIGMQDLLPTWRWWICSGNGSTNARKVPTEPIQMDFSFDDAWFGGSCLKAHGKSSRSDVRLFETKWTVSSPNDEFTITYKPTTTSGTMYLMVSKEGSEDTFTFVNTAPTFGQKVNQWITTKITASQLQLQAGDKVACLGLSFRNTPVAYSTLIGEISFIPAGYNNTPASPKITYTEVMKRYYNRADFKVAFDMPYNGQYGALKDGRPLYNEEVGTWYYEIWVRQKGKENLVATTTSWAHYVVEAPLDPETNNTDATFAIGVRAVGLDGKSKSAITWSSEIKKSMDVIDQITIDKEIIKPNENFTIGFEDPNHQSASFYIYNSAGTLVKSATNALTFTTSLPSIGSYDVKVVINGVEEMHRDMILVSKEETGRTPEVVSVTTDAAENFAGQPTNLTATINKGDTYNGKPCTVSRSLYMTDPYQFTVGADVLGSNEYTNVTYALWFKVKEFSHQSLGTLLMTKVNRNYGGTWTESIWGEMWTAIRPKHYSDYNNADDEISVNIHGPVAGTANYEHRQHVDLLSNGYTVRPNTWYHACVVVSGRNITLYLNGKAIATATSTGASPHYWNGAPFYVGGSMEDLASFTGWIDEVQIWNKALSASEVTTAMNGFSTSNIPSGLQGYFTFEEQKTDADGYIYFPNYGNKKSAVAGGYMTTKGSNGNTSIDVKQNNLTTAVGTPAITGSFPIVYEGTAWEGGTVSSSSDTKATMVFTQEGDNPVTVTATNSWGSAKKTGTARMSIHHTIARVAQIIAKALKGEATIEDVKAEVQQVLNQK